MPSVQVRGELIACNLADITPRFDKFLTETKTDLKTDDDFAQGEADAKASRDASKNLKLTAKAVVDQIAAVSDVVRTLESYAAKFDALGLKLEKAVKDQKEAIKIAIASSAREAFGAHIASLEEEIKPIRLGQMTPDFGAAMKSKRTISSLHEAVDALLAQAKVDADAAARDVRAKLAWCKENAEGYGFLFTDLQQIITKPMDDFQLVVTTLIDAHKKAEEEAKAKMEAEAKAKVEAMIGEVRPEPEGHPHVATAANVTAIRQEAVIDHQPIIAAFLKDRGFGKEESKVRAILVEYEKFKAEHDMKVAA